MDNDVKHNAAQTLRAVVATLNLVEVRGRDNLDRILGCINALEAVAQAIATTAKEEG